VDLELFINGVVVGSFTVLPGETSRSVSFFFPPISGPSYTIRLQETNTVYPGAGSIVIPLDTSPLRLIPPTASDIDIKPGNPDNVIPYKSRGKTQVAILSSETFDAPSQVARLTLTFGRTGDEASLSIHKKGTAQCDVWDADADGLADLVCAFLTEYTGFQPGDSEGVLKGETVAGILFEARDSVRVVPK
jgi:hypothetical protein